MNIIREVAEKFIEWVKIKIRINFLEKAFYFSEGQIWWASVGQNVGIEQNGKNAGFERSILILKKFNNEQFWSLPLSTKVKKNKYNYIFKKEGKEFCISLSQIRVMDKKRLLRLMEILPNDNLLEIKILIKKFL
ncbi:MAG: type II toxin-antitoxin system PemK/MazF family toxin [Candidatus Magasanikbacteria bacterium]